MGARKKNPEDDPATQFAENLDEKRKSFEEREGREEKEDDSSGVVEVSLDEPESDDDEDEPEEQSGARDQKKRQRLEDIKRQAAEEARREAAAQYEQQRRQDWERMQAHMLQQIRQQPQQQQPPQDPEKQALDAAYERQVALHERIQAKKDSATPEDWAKFEQERRSIESEIMQANYRIAMRQNQPRPEQVQEHQRQTFLRSRYPDVMSNPQLHQFANGYSAQEIAKGRQPSLELMDEAAEAARAAFGAGKKPDQATRDRFSGQSSRVQSGSAGGSRVRLTVGEQNMAKAWWKNVNPGKNLEDPEVAYKAWAKKHKQKKTA